MIRTFLTTTALAALIAGGANAQEQPAAPMTPEQPAATTPMTPAAPEGSMMSDDMTTLLARGYTNVDTDNLASNILGMPVYTSTADDAEQLGEVNDLVIGEDGSVEAVIVGVGGFLGIGEKNVAVSYSEIEWTVATDNTDRLVLATTREALEAAPDFVAEDDDMADTMTQPMDNMTPAAPGTPADPNATTTPMADSQMTVPYDRATLTDVALTADELEGVEAYGPADEHLGGIGDILLGQDGTTVEAVIIDFGGFLGIGTKQVAVAIENMSLRTDQNGNRFAFLNVTREQLDAAVEFNADTFTTERDTQLLATDPVVR